MASVAPVVIGYEKWFVDALCAHGIGPSSSRFVLVADGKVHRYQGGDDRKGRQNCWYVLHDDPTCPWGAFGSWKTGVEGYWSAKHESTLTEQEKQEFKRRQAEAWRLRDEEERRLRAAAREKAARLWAMAKPARAPVVRENGEIVGHGYLIKKRVRPYGLRQLRSLLVVPVRNAAGALVNLQFISENGDKRFLTGGETEGCYFAIGELTDTILLAEGCATALSLREAVEASVACAFSASNFLAVGRGLRAKLPGVRLLFCADDDSARNNGNVGLNKAADAAGQVGGLVVVPSLSDGDKAAGLKDFNDLATKYGMDAVRACVDSVTANVAVLDQRRVREQLERRIAAAEDFNELTETLAGEVNSSGLPKPAMDFLRSQIAKKAGVSKASLVPVGGGRRRSGVSGDAGMADIHEMNERFAVVPVGGKVRIAVDATDPGLMRPYFVFENQTDFELRHANRTIQGMNAGAFWLQHPLRRQYEGIVFMPGRDVPGYLNLWRGWPLQPVDGDCSRFLEFVRAVICGGDSHLEQYVLDWCAHLVQRPDELPETALVLRGREGIGKNTFVDMLAAVVGVGHFVLLSSLDQVTGRFSGHLASALLVFCNESVWGGNKAAQGVLKSQITDPIQPVEFKGLNIEMIRSFRRMIFGTNEDWAVPRGPDDRRYVCMDVSDAHKGDWDYFRSIRAEMESGGAAAFYSLLLKRDIDGWHPRMVPLYLLQKGWDIKIDTAGSVERWWFDLLQAGWIREAGGHYSPDEGVTYEWPEDIGCGELQSKYLAWCQAYRVVHPETASRVSRKLKPFGVVTYRPAGVGDRPRKYKLPKLQDARLKFGEVFGLPAGAWADDGDEKVVRLC